MDDTQKLLIEILQRVTSIETKIDGYDTMDEKVEAAYNMSKNNEEDIKEMKDTQKWFWRTTVGSVITMVCAVILAWLKIGGGK